MSEVCMRHVLTKTQVEMLLKNKYDIEYNNYASQEYTRIYRMYLKICENGMLTEYGNKEEEVKFMEIAKQFIYRLGVFMSPISKKICEMENAMTLMLCNNQRCLNYTTWNQTMDRSFLNWLSHRLSEMAHDRLGLKNSNCMSLGRKTLNETAEKVRECIGQKLVNKKDDPEFIDDLMFAQTCYETDYLIREMRHPESNDDTGICREIGDVKHKSRKWLALSLSIVVQEWIDIEEEKEETSNKRQRLK